MKKANIPCLIEHRRKKWRMAKRRAPLPEERWSRRTAEWDPDLDNCIKTNRSVGRPRKRWEDEINDFIKTEEISESIGSDQKKRHMATASKAAKRIESERRRICKKQQRQDEIGTDELKQTRAAEHSVLSFTPRL